MTAGHCLSPFDVKDIFVYAGVLSKDNVPNPKSDHIYEIQEKIFHPKYGKVRRKTVFDMGLVVIKGTFKLNGQTIAVACLPGPSFTPNAVQRDALTAVGWGRTEQDKPSTTLLKITEKIVPLTDCNKSQQRADPATQFCATGGPRKATCDVSHMNKIMFVLLTTICYISIG